MKSNIASLFCCVVLSLISFVAAANDGRTVSITATNKVDGFAKSLGISLGATTVTNTLFVAYDVSDKGDDIGAWSYVDRICVVTPETNNVVYSLPDDWGNGITAIRFFLAKGVVQPYDYEVEYLNTTGSQYLVFPPLTFTYLTTRLMQSVPVTKRMFILGTGSYCWYEIKANGKFMNGADVPIGTPFTVTMTNINDIGHVYINGVDSGDIQGNSTERYKLFYGKIKFGVGGNPGYSPIIGGIYKTTVYNGLKQVANAIPVMTNGVACFYDTVNRVYYRQNDYTPGGDVVGFVRDQDERTVVSASQVYKSEITVIVESTLEEPTGMNPPPGNCVATGEFKSAPICELGKYRYTCKGYTLEEFVDGEWKVVETASSLLYNCPNDGVSKRLTWNWELTHYKLDIESSPSANGNTVLVPDIEDRFYPVNSTLTMIPSPNSGATHVGYYIISDKWITPGSENKLRVAHPEGPITLTIECPKTIKSYYAGKWVLNGTSLTNGVWKLTVATLGTGLKVTKYHAGHGMMDFRNVENDTGKKVLGLGGSLFHEKVYYDGITSFYGPDVYLIEGRVFQYCYSLQHVEVSPNLETMGVCVFCDTTSLTNIVPNKLPKLKSVGSTAFRSNSKLAIDFEAPLCTTVAGTAFSGSGLRSITLPSVITIGEEAFKSCANLTNAIVAASTLGGSAFYMASALREVHFTNPNGVSAFPNYIFTSCNKLTDVWYYGAKAPASVGQSFNVTRWPSVHVKDNKDLEGWRALATRVVNPAGGQTGVTAADIARADYPGRRAVGLMNTSRNNFWIVKWPVNITTLFLVF